MTMNNFNTDFEFSKRSKETIFAFLRKSEFIDSIEDVENSKFYQNKGIDALLKSKNGTITAELKADRYPANNIVFETQSNVDKNSPGCFIYSRANLWIYHYVNSGVACIFEHSKALVLFGQKYSKRKPIFSKTNVGKGHYRTQCTLVNVNEFERDMHQIGAFFQKVVL